MFIPLHDSTPLKVIRFQAVTIAIIVLNVAAYLATGAFSTDAVLGAIAAIWGVVPGELTGMAPPLLPVEPVPRRLMRLKRLSPGLSTRLTSFSAPRVVSETSSATSTTASTTDMCARINSIITALQNIGITA